MGSTEAGAPVGDEVRGDPADAQGQGKALRDECNVFRGLRRPVVSYDLAPVFGITRAEAQRPICSLLRV